jgi:hypothetical protein
MELSTWTIYERSDGFHLAEWTIVAEGLRISPTLQKFPSLKAARKAVPAGLYRVPRSPEDAPDIVETWL